MSNGSFSLPREIAPGVFWLGECFEQEYYGEMLHTYNSCFLIAGSEASLLVESGFPRDFLLVVDQIERLLVRSDVPPLKYIFLTHQETPHAAGMSRLMSQYPDLLACGDMADYHLIFPHFADRFRWMEVGDEIDLGGRRFQAVEPVIRDLPTTLWGFDDRAKVLFPGDGFSFSHYHRDGHCGRFAEEAPSLDIPEALALFAELALYWTKFCDMTHYVERLDQLVDELGVKAIAPTHGLPIGDMGACFGLVKEGFLYASRKEELGTSQAGRVESTVSGPERE